MGYNYTNHTTNDMSPKLILKCQEKLNLDKNNAGLHTYFIGTYILTSMG